MTFLSFTVQRNNKPFFTVSPRIRIAKADTGKCYRSSHTCSSKQVQTVLRCTFKFKTHNIIRLICRTTPELHVMKCQTLKRMLCLNATLVSCPCYDMLQVSSIYLVKKFKFPKMNPCTKKSRSSDRRINMRLLFLFSPQGHCASSVELLVLPNSCNTHHDHTAHSGMRDRALYKCKSETPTRSRKRRLCDLSSVQLLVLPNSCDTHHDHTAHSGMRDRARYKCKSETLNRSRQRRLCNLTCGQVLVPIFQTR